MKLAAYAVTGALAFALAACGGDSRDEEDARARGETTTVTQAEAESGLAALGLAEPGRANWEARSFENGRYVFSGFTFVSEDADAPFRAEELIIAAPRLEDGEVLFDRIELTNGSVEDDEARITLARFVVDRPGPFLARQVADALTGAENEVDAEDLTQEELEGYRFAEIALEGLTVESSVEGDATIRLERIGASDFDGARLARFAMTGLDVEAEDAASGRVTVTLDEMMLEGLASAFVRAMADSAGAGSRPNLNVANPFNPADMYDAFAVRGLNVNAAGAAIAMPEYTGDVSERGGDVRTVASMPSLSVRAEGDGENAARLRDALDRLGYESLDFSLHAESLYDPDTDRVRTQGDNYIEMRDGFRLSFEQDIGGLAEYTERYMNAVASGNLETDGPPVETFEPLVIHGLSLRLQDLSLLERAIDAGAEAQNMTPETLRMQAAAMVGMGLLAAPAEVPRPFVTALGDALTDFINNGGALIVAFNPEEPVSVGDLMAQSGALDVEALGLDVRAEPPE